MAISSIEGLLSPSRLLLTEVVTRCLHTADQFSRETDENRQVVRLEFQIQALLWVCAEQIECKVIVVLYLSGLFKGKNVFCCHFVLPLNFTLTTIKKQIFWKKLTVLIWSWIFLEFPITNFGRAPLLTVILCCSIISRRQKLPGMQFLQGRGQFNESDNHRNS